VNTLKGAVGGSDSERVVRLKAALKNDLRLNDLRSRGQTRNMPFSLLFTYNKDLYPNSQHVRSPREFSLENLPESAIEIEN
jgi:hypothetical protein